MQRRWVFLVLILATLIVIIGTIESQPGSEQLLNVSRAKRVIGGVKVPANDIRYSFAAHLEGVLDRFWQFLWATRIRHCGATLINERWLLTAAHCFMKPRTVSPSDWTLTFHYQEAVTKNKTFLSKMFDAVISLFSTSSKPTGSGSSHAIETIIVHPDYNQERDGFLNDVALVKLSEPVIGVIPAELETEDDGWPTKLDAERCVVVGFGCRDYVFTLNDSEKSQRIHKHKYLSKAAIRIIPPEHCTWYVDGRTQFCAYAPEVALCDGDSGGALLCPRREALTVVGIASFGMRDDVAKYYASGFTKVAPFKSWIQSTIRTNT